MEDVKSIEQTDGMVRVEVVRDKQVHFSMCSAIDLLNTLTKVINNADIKFAAADGKIKYTITVNQEVLHD